MSLEDAKRLQESISAERLKKVLSPSLSQSKDQRNKNKTVQPSTQQKETNHNPLDDDEDFVNEQGEFAAKLRLYDDENGKADLAYYGLAGDIVRAIDPHTEADPVATLITFLTAFGNMIGDHAHFTAGATKHPVRLFAVVVGKTGKGRKGTSLSPVKLLLKAVQPNWVKEHIHSGMSSGEGLIHAVRDEEIKKEPVFDGAGADKEVVDYNIIVVDQGIEDKRLFVVEEEFGRALRAAKREGNTLSAIIRQLWDDGSPRTMTKNPTKTTNAHVSILGQITEEELKGEVSALDLVNGFANRFLWLMVERSKFLPSGGQFHKVNLEPLVKRIGAAVEFSQTVDELTRDKEADQLWHKIYEELSTGAGGTVGAVTSRAEAQTMRLACAYALLDCSEKITIHHLKAALSLWNYCFKSARFIFGNASVLERPKAQELLDELKRRRESGIDGMTRTEVRDFFNRNASKTELDAIFKDLLSNGFIKLEKVRSQGAKRPTQRIALIE